MPLLDLLLTMFWLFLFFAWIWLVITVFIDIFRSDDLSGWGKAGWTIFVIILPLLGVLIYVIARGDKMQQRRIDDATAQKQATDAYIRQAAGSGSGVAAATAASASECLRAMYQAPRPNRAARVRNARLGIPGMTPSVPSTPAVTKSGLGLSKSCWATSASKDSRR